jgi:signal transduction histidine kinase
MRRSLAGISVAVTSLVAVAFLLPLLWMVGDVVRSRALSEGYRTASSVAPLLALTTRREDIARAVAGTDAGSAGRMTVSLPDFATTSDRSDVVGTARAADRVAQVFRDDRAIDVEVRGGRSVLQPVVLGGGRTAVVEVDVPTADLTAGVGRTRAVLVLVALVLVIGSTLFADRLAARVVRSARHLRDASARLGTGDLQVRITPRGPAELREAAIAFNTMADQVTALLAAERELAADLSHRLRTPVAGLLTACRHLDDGQAAAQVRSVADMLGREVDGIIRDARSARERRAVRCDAVEVLRERLEFWGALAQDQERQWRLDTPVDQVWIPVAGKELAAVVDALIGNVFLHTEEGLPFVVGVEPLGDGGPVRMWIDDAGPGIVDPGKALRRGDSGAGSTGLGLDIARRLVETTGGNLDIGRAPSGGARVELLFRTRGEEPGATRRRRRKRGIVYHVRHARDSGTYGYGLRRGTCKDRR